MFTFIKKTYKSWFFLSFAISSILLLPLIFLFYDNIYIDSNIWSHIYENLLFEYIVNTILLIIPVCVLSIIISYYSAYIITFYDIHYKRLFDLLLILPLAIPSYIMTYTYSYFFSYSGDFYSLLRYLGLENHFHFNFFNNIVLILLLTFSLYPYLYISYRNYFSSLPNSILFTIKSLSLSSFKSNFKILLPLSRPSMVSGLFLIIMELLNEYGAVKYFGYKTFTVGIFRVWLGMNSITSALNLSFYLLLFVVILIYVDSLLKGNKKYSLKKDLILNSINLYSNKKLHFVFILIISLFTFILPFFLILKNSLNIGDFLYFDDLISSFLNTIYISILASIFIFIFSLILNFNKEYNKSTFLDAIIKFSTAGYAFPGAVIALACISLFSYVNNNLFTFSISSGIFILAYALVIRFIAVSYNTLKSGNEGTSEVYLKTYRSFGKSSIKNLFKVYLPNQKGFIISSFILVFVDISKELPLTLILRPFNFDTLATRTFDFAGDEMLLEASFPALIIVLTGIFSILFFKRISK